MKKKQRILLIDNYDSFTYNLVQAFQVENAEVLVYRNDEIDIQSISDINPTHIVISPGPGNPKNAGISIKVIESFYQTHPILGVCLGHQCLVEFFGGKIIRAEKLMHGKTSQIEHDNQTIFKNMSQPFTAGRYHSLSADKSSMPDQLHVSAKTEEGEIMGVRHEFFPIEGVQFHPESILTPEGPRLVHNFLRYVK
tara:strand:- start:864 stop:1448 length:585 start_codon:yes stop_codon:yes gene_type:complete